MVYFLQGDGPTLNEIPSARVKRGLICGIFRKPRWCDDGFKVFIINFIFFIIYNFMHV